MLAKRIIPCLDVRDGRVVKGINFVGIKEVGDPVECAVAYDRQGADEIVFLDITASHEKRGTMADVVRETAKHVFVPLTVGGGIRSADDFRDILRAGADKISINSAAVQNPALISEAADKFGNQCVVVAIDAKRMEDGGYHVYINGGRIDTGSTPSGGPPKRCVWARGKFCSPPWMPTAPGGLRHRYAERRLQGCIRSRHRVRRLRKAFPFSEVFEKSGADAALAASLFHYGELTIGQVKEELKRKNIPVRMR
jgi:cyclase